MTNIYRQRNNLHASRGKDELEFVSEFDLDESIISIAEWVRSEKELLPQYR